MKKIILLIFMSVILAVSNISSSYSYSDDVEFMDKLETKTKKDFYDKKTSNCDEYAKKNLGKYSHENVRDYCCSASFINYQAPLPEDVEKRINSISKSLQNAKNECGNKMNQCLEKRLQDLNYQCHYVIN